MLVGRSRSKVDALRDSFSSKTFRAELWRSISVHGYYAFGVVTRVSIRNPAVDPVDYFSPLTRVVDLCVRDVIHRDRMEMTGR